MDDSIESVGCNLTNTARRTIHVVGDKAYGSAAENIKPHKFVIHKINSVDTKCAVTSFRAL